MSYAYTAVAKVQEVSTDNSRLKYLVPASQFGGYFAVRLGIRSQADPPSTPLKERDVLLAMKDITLRALVRRFRATGEMVLVTIQDSTIISIKPYVLSDEPDQPAVPASDSETWGKILGILGAKP